MRRYFEDRLLRSWQPGEYFPGLLGELIEGELLLVREPATLLPRLDDFEGFRPETTDWQYLRALLPLAGEQRRFAWAYVAPGGQLPAGAQRIGRRWPPLPGRV